MLHQIFKSNFDRCKKQEKLQVFEKNVLLVLITKNKFICTCQTWKKWHVNIFILDTCYKNVKEYILTGFWEIAVKCLKFHRFHNDVEKTSVVCQISQNQMFYSFYKDSARFIKTKLSLTLIKPIKNKSVNITKKNKTNLLFLK